jgi:hypothetical protein
MILLTTSSDLIQIITGGTQQIKVHASYVDVNGSTVTPGRTNTAIASAATTTVVGGPGSPATLARGAPESTGSFVLSGSPVGLLYDRWLAPTFGALVLIGEAGALAKFGVPALVLSQTPRTLLTLADTQGVALTLTHTPKTQLALTDATGTTLVISEGR